MSLPLQLTTRPIDIIFDIEQNTQYTIVLLMFRIAVLLSGRGSNFRAIFDDLNARPLSAQIIGVISDNPKADGIAFAQSNNLPCFVVERRKKELSLEDFFSNLTKTVSDLAPDLIVLAGFMRLLPKDLVLAFDGKIINIHPSLLPAFKGLRAQQQALNAGVTQAGCTVHYVVPEMDSGAIIEQATVPVLPGDTEESLSARILAEEHILYPAVVRKIVEGKIRLVKDKIVREN